MYIYIYIYSICLVLWILWRHIVANWKGAVNMQFEMTWIIILERGSKILRKRWFWLTPEWQQILGKSISGVVTWELELQIIFENRTCNVIFIEGLYHKEGITSLKNCPKLSANWYQIHRKSTSGAVLDHFGHPLVAKMAQDRHQEQKMMKIR